MYERYLRVHRWFARDHVHAAAYQWWLAPYVCLVSPDLVQSLPDGCDRRANEEAALDVNLNLRKIQQDILIIITLSMQCYDFSMNKKK